MSSKLVLDSNVIAYLVLGTKKLYKADPRNNENILCTLRRCYLTLYRPPRDARQSVMTEVIGG